MEKRVQSQSGENRVNYETYKVQEGDTLSQIVWRQYHSLDKMAVVKRINKIESSNSIIAGQVIKLPVR